MGRTERLEQIIRGRALLERRDIPVSQHYEFQRLVEESESAQLSGAALDVYPVRAVSRSEVLCRRLVREIVDHSRANAVRSIALISELKPDYNMLLSVADDEFTFGDVVASSVSVSNLVHIHQIFETLLDIKLSVELVKVRNEYGFVPLDDEEPLISDRKQVWADVQAVYTIRHRVCHEALNPSSQDFQGLAAKLKSFKSFFDALSGFVAQALDPDIPRTQLEMNVRAGQRLREAREEMQRYIALINDRYRDWPEELRAFKEAQNAWETFVSKQEILRHNPQGGGSIGPYLRALEAEDLTLERVDHLRWYAEREEGEL